MQDFIRSVTPQGWQNQNNLHPPEGTTRHPSVVGSVSFSREQRILLKDRQRRHLRRIAEMRGFAYDAPGRCLWHALAAIRAGMELGVRILPQAGTVCWRINDDADAKINAFGYEWNPNWRGDALNRAVVADTDLPEIHIWNAVMPVGTDPFLVDFSTEYFPRGCSEPWTAKFPPEVFWLAEDGAALGHERGFAYIPNVEATAFALSRLQHAYRIVYQSSQRLG